MAKRHDALGIKQTMRLEWLQRAASLVAAGLEPKASRSDLHEYLAERRGTGLEGTRSDQARTFVVNCLMRTWVTPDAELLAFRDALLALVQGHPSSGLAAHWAMISAAYPFWFNVARQTGRLLALQEQVTQAQILGRVLEQYGDRQSVTRYGRFVLRSLIAWDVLADSDTRGCYCQPARASVLGVESCAFLLEAGLHATPEAKAELGVLLGNPGLFPFQLPSVTAEQILQCNARLDVARFGLDAELMRLKDA